MLIAGEASGDLHAAGLIAALRSLDAGARFAFLGGDNMSREAGTTPAVHYRDMAYMGFSEVLRNLGAIRRNMAVAKDLLRLFAPDVLILVDYPGFNLRLAKTAKKMGIRTVYFIPPKIWAWKKWRVRTIRRLIDHVYAIFPFEVGFYKSHGYDRVTYVGNPSVAEIDGLLKTDPTKADFVARHRLPSRPIIALLPGSRRGEIRNNLPVMLAAADRFVQYRPVVAGAPGIERSFYAGMTSAPVVFDDTVTLLHHCQAALVTSGTATLEAALTATPQVACYRANGSRLSYNIMKRLLTVPFVTLPNLIAGRQVIPEMLLHFCTPVAVGDCLAQIVPAHSQARADQLQGYADIRAVLGTKDAAMTAARHIVGQVTGAGIQ